MNKKDIGDECSECSRLYTSGKMVTIIRPVHLYSDEIKIEKRFYCHEHKPKFDFVLNSIPYKFSKYDISRDNSMFFVKMRPLYFSGENQYPKFKVFEPDLED